MLRVKVQLEAEMNIATRSLKQFKSLDVMLIKKESELKQLKKTQDRLKTKFSDLQALFANTLNVKLRYEQIIKNLMENEKMSSQNKKSVAEVIKSTKPKTMVVTDKQLNNQLREFTQTTFGSPEKIMTPSSALTSSISLTKKNRGKSAILRLTDAKNKQSN